MSSLKEGTYYSRYRAAATRFEIIGCILLLIAVLLHVVLGSSILTASLLLAAVGAFLLIIGGAFELVNASGAILALCRTVGKKLKGKEIFVVPMFLALFAVFGTTMGMSNEVAIFVPIGITMALTLGLDKVTGMAMVAVGAATGFTAGLMNPFTVGVAQDIAGVPLFSGMGLRAVLLIAMLVIDTFYIIANERKIKKHPEKSILAGLPDEKDFVPDEGADEEITGRQTAVLVVLFGTLAILIYGLLIYQWYFEEMAALFLVMGVICGFLGAKLLYVIVEFDRFLEAPMQVLGSEGFVVYGGIITGVLSAVFYCKKKNLVFLEYFDLLAPSIALAQGFGRIGCFLAGCCYGRETQCFLGVTFPEGSLAPAGVKLLPTQLISSAGDFLILAVLLLYSRKSRQTGNTGALYLLLYGIGRFLVEFLRADDRGAVGALSTSQFISIGIVLVGILLFLRRRIFLVKKDSDPSL